MNQSKLDNSTAKVKTNVEAMNRRLNDTKQIRDLDDKIMEITQSEQQTKTNEKNKQDLWDNIKCANLHIIGVPERRERQKGIDNVSWKKSCL